MTKGMLHDSRVRDHGIMHLGLNLNSSTRNCGSMVNGSNAMAAL